MTCAPQWYVDGLSCPNGYLLPLGITYPFNADFWQVIGVIYGYLMWVVFFYFILVFLIRRGTRELVLALVPAVAMGVTELIKLFVKEIRPPESCLHSCGMPSGHASVSVSMIAYIALDGTSIARTVAQGSADKSRIWDIISGRDCEVSQRTYARYFIFVLLLMLPIPISRVLVGDHYPSQVMAGSLLGLVVGWTLFELFKYIRGLWYRKLGACLLCGLIRHNYPPDQTLTMDTSIS